ncbi:MAG: pilD [Bacillales bacterium]|jgi:leader peptidase (prepilin peptidase)/N-methyltransferase|nr:pilD [Bacillales bacterium]
MVFFAEFFLYFNIFVFGICIGSFLNVVIWRVPNKLSFVKGRSFCPKCNEQIKSYDLIPILSFLMLGGKCRNCHSKISFRYPLIEFIVGLLFVFSFYILGFTLSAILVCSVVSILVCVTMVDFDTMEIPDGFTITLMIPAIAAIFIFPELSITARVIGFFAVSLPMFLIAWLTGGFGGGDVKLIAVCGFLLGWQNVLVATFIALVLGAIVGVYLKVTHKIDNKQLIAFGPYLCAGIYIAILFGNQLIDSYLSLFNLLAL